MAGTKTGLPANGSTDWSKFVDMAQQSWRHMSFVSFTNTTSTGAPAIEAGSYTVVNGSMYSLTPSTGGAETISTTGLSTGFAAGDLWIKAVPTTGDSITSEYTTSPPVWSTPKGGYYSGNDKYLGGVSKKTNPYGEKWSFPEGVKFQNGETRPMLKKIFTIPPLNMKTTTLVSIAHDTPSLDKFFPIFNVSGYMKSDNLAPYQLQKFPFVAGNVLFVVNSSAITVQSSTESHFFNSTWFSSTGDDRGVLILEYRG